MEWIREFPLFLRNPLFILCNKVITLLFIKEVGRLTGAHPPVLVLQGNQSSVCLTHFLPLHLYDITTCIHTSTGVEISVGTQYSRSVYLVKVHRYVQNTGKISISLSNRFMPVFRKYIHIFVP
jgi:hypothetical protein